MPDLKPPHPRALGAQRFFARVVAFIAECPHCGHVTAVRQKNQHGSVQPALYDKRTARWTCNECERVYVVGLLAWPPPRGAGSKGIPDDQVPGPRELAQMRADGSGYWLPDALRDTGRMDMSNLTTEPDRPDPVDPIDLDLAIHPGVDWTPPEED